MPFARQTKIENAHDEGIWAVDWRGNRVATGSVASRARVKTWKSKPEPAQEHILERANLGIVSVSLSPTSSLLATSSLDSCIRLWDLREVQPALLHEIECDPVEAWALKVSPDARSVAVTGQSGNITFYSTETAQKGMILSPGGKFTMSVAFSGDGRFVACGASDGAVTLFEVATGRKVYSLPGHAMTVRSLAFSPDSTLLFTGCDDRHTNVYDVQEGELVYSLSGHSSWVLSVNANPAAKLIATGSSDKTVKIWDLTTHKCVHTFTDHQDQVWSVAHNEQGTELASVSDDKALIFYSVSP
ncbi:WD repeat protein 61 [Pelomyxa schiedti]|nr:WD repeat protein 61 [Pelomyxa schiedti]